MVGISDTAPPDLLYIASECLMVTNPPFSSEVLVGSNFGQYGAPGYACSLGSPGAREQ